MDGLESQKTPFKHGTNVGISDFRCCMSWLQPPPNVGSQPSSNASFAAKDTSKLLGLHVLLQPGVRPGIPTWLLQCGEESRLFFLTPRGSFDPPMEGLSNLTTRKMVFWSSNRKRPLRGPGSLGLFEKKGLPGLMFLLRKVSLLYY